MTAPCKFIVVASATDIEWRCRQVRENLKEGSVMATTPVQRIFDINDMRLENGARLTRDQLVDLYNGTKTLRLSSKSEPNSKGWANCAFTIWDRALSVPAIQEVVLAEESFKEDSILSTSSGLS